MMANPAQQLADVITLPARTVGNQIGRQIVRGILGSLFGGRR